jgi:hypothetical protein
MGYPGQQLNIGNNRNPQAPTQQDNDEDQEMGQMYWALLSENLSH